MTTRQLIGEATGILMARQNITQQDAFDMLRRASQRLNIKLREVAEQIVSAHEESAQAEVDDFGIRQLPVADLAAS